jgi:hypothetical protein
MSVQNAKREISTYYFFIKATFSSVDMMECLGTRKCLVMLTNKSDSENSSRPYSVDISCSVCFISTADLPRTYFSSGRSKFVGVYDDTPPSCRFINETNESVYQPISSEVKGGLTSS